MGEILETAVPLPRPSLDRLTSDQQRVFQQVLKEMQDVNFDYKTLFAKRQEMAALFATVLHDNEEIQRFEDELDLWVHWRRLHAYWLTFFFQLVTMNLTDLSLAKHHVIASLLYSTAQTHVNDDLAENSIEIAYDTLRKLQGDEPELFRDVREYIEAQLEQYHNFYTKWSKAFLDSDSPQNGCNPIVENLYFYKTWAELKHNFSELKGNLSGQACASALLNIIERCGTADYVYYRIVARRFLALIYLDQDQIDGAIDQLKIGIQEALEWSLDTEIAHFYRLHAYALSKLKPDHPSEAIEQFEKARQCDQILLFSYWYALSSYELGTQWVRIAQSNSKQPQKFAEGLVKAEQIYREARQRFDSHLASHSFIPLARVIKQQMFRPYTETALSCATTYFTFFFEARTESEPLWDQIKMGIHDILALIETRGPREIATLATEIWAVQSSILDTPTDFKKAQEVFHRHLTSVPETFEQYLGELPDQYDSRYKYLNERTELPPQFLKQQLTDQIVSDFLSLQGALPPNTFFLFFDIGRVRSTVFLLDLSQRFQALVAISDEVNEGTCKELHREYHAALAEIEKLQQQNAEAQEIEAVISAAVRRLLSGYKGLVESIMQSILNIARRAPEAPLRLVVFPRLYMNEVPLQAICIKGRPLIEYCDISYAQTISLLTREHLSAGSPASGVTMVFNDQDEGSWLYAGLRKSLEEIFPNKAIILPHPSWEQIRTQVSSGQTSDLIFACHGEYYPANPAASFLKVGSDQEVTFPQLFGGILLPNCRSVVMGACKSGLARTELGAEFIGLPSVFLSAGAQYVIGSLWSVDDLATVILLDQFFELLGTEARLVPNALNEAERRLARMTSGQVLAWLDEHMSPRLASAYKPVIEKMGSSPFDSPFFWAGFYVSGDI